MTARSDRSVAQLASGTSGATITAPQLRNAGSTTVCMNQLP
jgi:hypothetical protein